MTCPASPAFVTFTTALLCVARSVEDIHATDAADHQTVARAGRQLRQHVATLDHAILQLDRAEHLEACSLLAALADRIPARGALDALEPCRELLGRFAPPPAGDR